MSLEYFRSTNKESDIPIKCAWAGTKVKTEDSLENCLNSPQESPITDKETRSTPQVKVRVNSRSVSGEGR